MYSLQLKLIFSLGTSNRSFEEFIELLNIHGLEVVADVRRFPSSRFEHFKRENLANLLNNKGVNYIYLGNELGGFRKGGYKNFTRTPEFKVGLKNLEQIAEKNLAVIVCAERFPWHCHRRFIALELEKKGWQVNHIIDKKRNWMVQKNFGEEE